jgi:sucrose phosphorylase
LNISYFDALSDPQKVDQEGLETQIRRFISSQAIMLCLAGVPGIYVHSLLGSRSYHAGVERTGRYRTINREKLQRRELERELADPTSLRHRVFQRYADLLRVRRSQPAFHPNGSQKIILSNRALFSLLRTSPDNQEHILCVHSVSDQEQVFEANLSELGVADSAGAEDLVTGESHRADEAGRLRLAVAPYQVLWLKASGGM